MQCATRTFIKQRYRQARTCGVRTTCTIVMRQGRAGWTGRADPHLMLLLRSQGFHVALACVHTSDVRNTHWQGRVSTCCVPAPSWKPNRDGSTPWCVFPVAAGACDIVGSAVSASAITLS
jgi:hypothetical protein